MGEPRVAARSWLRADESALQQLLAGVVEPDPTVAAVAADRFDELAKPPGSLGMLEDLGCRLAALHGVAIPPVPADPVVLVAAADHGVVASGVTMWDSGVTTAMIDVCRGGGAAVNALAAAVGARVDVLDVGAVGEPGAPFTHPTAAPPATYRRQRVRAGTDDLSRGPAMRREDAVSALVAGAQRAADLIDDGADLIVTGDLGIGNTTASACLVAALTGAPVDSSVGRGAGADDATLARKRLVVREAVARVRAHAGDAVEVLAACGGLEHAALAGAVLTAAGRRVPVLLDGSASVAAALVATRLAPSAIAACVAGHVSAEPASAVGLEYLGLSPLLDLSLRLGEGTGGVLAVPLVRAAANALAQMALLADVSGPSGDPVTGYG